MLSPEGVRKLINNPCLTDDSSSGPGKPIMPQSAWVRSVGRVWNGAMTACAAKTRTITASLRSFAESVRRVQFSDWLQLCLLLVAIVGAVVAWRAWSAELEKRKLEATLKYIEPLSQREFLDDLFDLHEFTICFENKQGHHISYLLSRELYEEEIKANAIRLAKSWWFFVENNVSVEKGCAADQLDRKLARTLSKITMLSACLESEICSYTNFLPVAEALFLEGFLSFSNYIMLSLEADVSRGWIIFDTSKLRSFLDRLEEEFEEYLLMRREGIRRGKATVKVTGPTEK